MFYKANKSECFTPGFLCVLHTFGRDLKWNPHIHALISEGGAGNFTDWRTSILLTFGYDPLRCEKCVTSLLVLEVYHKKTALFERYRKVMGYG